MTDATGLRLAIVSGLLRQYPLDLALAKIAEAGYDGVELWGGQNHGYVLDLVEEVDGELALDVARAEAIRDPCAARGLPIVCLTPEQLIYPINWLTATLLESGYRGWMSAELGIRGEYALPEQAGPLHEARRQMTAVLETVSSTLRRSRRRRLERN